MRTLALVAAGAIALGGCLALGSLDDFTVAPGEGGAGGSTDGTGGTGGSGGGTGGAECGTLEDNECAAANNFVAPIRGTGDVEITDIDTVTGGGIVMVGLFTGTLTLGASTIGATGTDGFVYEVDSNGTYVAHKHLPEADAGSQLFVDYDDTGGDLISVGGTFTEALTDCPGGSAGFFAHALTLNGATYDDLYPAPGFRCVVHDSGMFDAHDVVGSIVGPQAYISIGGSFRGTFEGNTATDTDGVVVGFSTNEAITTIAMGGAGDEVVKRLENGGSNQLLVAGEFDESLSITIPHTGNPDLMFDATALGPRDIFIGVVDGFAEAPNLLMSTMGSPGATQELIDLSFAPQTTQAFVLVGMSGDLVFDGIAIADTSIGQSAVAIEFITPLDGLRVLDYIGHTVISAPMLSATHVARTVANEFHIGGTATGPLTIAGSSANELGVLQPVSCAEEAFLLSINGTVLEETQRCGGESQRLGGLTYTATSHGMAAAINVPAGTTIDLGADYTAGANDEAALVIQRD